MAQMMRLIGNWKLSLDLLTSISARLGLTKKGHNWLDKVSSLEVAIKYFRHDQKRASNYIIERSDRIFGKCITRSHWRVRSVAITARKHLVRIAATKAMIMVVQLGNPSATKRQLKYQSVPHSTLNSAAIEMRFGISFLQQMLYPVKTIRHTSPNL